MAIGEARDVAPAGLLGRIGRDAPRIDTPEAYHQAVLTDLQDLLGTVRRWPDSELGEHREVGRSVLNYGVSPLTGRVVSRDSADELAGEIRATILRFDGRFDPATFHVTATVDPDRTPLDALVLRLEGNLRGFPQPVPFFARATANLDSGFLEFLPEAAA